jgi:hypothetical protein
LETDAEMSQNFSMRMAILSGGNSTNNVNAARARTVR